MNAYNENLPELPTIDEISIELPAVSEYCPATRLPELFKSLAIDTLPVVNTFGKLVGIISEYDLAKILPEWSFNEESYLHDYLVSSLMTSDVWTETSHTNISELLAKINKMHTRVIPIVEENGTYTGTVITRTGIVEYLTRFVKPRSLGGLATPLGVYITDGKHQAGAGNLGLFLTGALLGTIIYIVQSVFLFIFGISEIEKLENQYIPLFLVGEIFLFLLILRFTPLVKIHAAEHQTINAIEKGMPLSIETVKMQPKEHIRCGTNLMVLILGIQFVILVYASYLTSINPLFQFVFLITAFSFVFSNWKKGGMLLQKYFTTVKASEKYILSGIKAGQEILKKNKEDTDPASSSFLSKLWNIGLIQIISGFILINYFFDTIRALLFITKSI
ncbi:MAG TPA: DUF1385 domain-containing protein [Candidatus Gastranaerophilales bacterium]|nr:DUF1385 domain-containing protein [Candidatus Gastranaerophilales bacterium]